MAQVSFYPVSDNGVQWNPSSGGNCWSLIDETPHDGDTTYIYYNIGFPQYVRPAARSVPTNYGINFVRVSIVARKEADATNVTLKAGLFYPTVAKYHPDIYYLTDEYVQYDFDWTQNPSTNLPWTESQAETYFSDMLLWRPGGTGNARITQAVYTIDYKENFTAPMPCFRP